MPEQREQIQRLPGNTVPMKVTMLATAAPNTPKATSIFISFDQVKHLLSSRPLHRPKRQSLSH